MAGFTALGAGAASFPSWRLWVTKQSPSTCRDTEIAATRSRPCKAVELRSSKCFTPAISWWATPAVAAAIHSAEEDLKDSGRVVIRYSGTEPLARVMIEAENGEAMKRHAESIAAAIRNELGA